MPLARVLKIFALVFAIAAVSPSQTPPPIDPTDLLLRLHAQITSMLDRLPNFLASEDIDRTSFISDEKTRSSACDSNEWQTRENAVNSLRLDVAYASHEELYANSSDHVFPTQSLFGLVPDGTISTGAFAAFLASIFTSDTAQFKYAGLKQIEGRSLAEFNYRVDRNHGYALNAEVNGLTSTAAVPFEGSFFVDTATRHLVHLNVHALAIPPELRICDQRVALDYAPVQLNGSEFDLPKAAAFDTRFMGGDRSYNVARISNYHRFTATSTLDFGPAAPPNPTPVKPAPSPAVDPIVALTPDQARILDAARQKINTSVARLPRYLCTETIDRNISVPIDDESPKNYCAALAESKLPKPWPDREASADRLRIDVAVSSDGEMFSWVGENHFGDAGIAQLVDSDLTSSGAFSGFLAAIFGAPSADFAYAGETAQAGRRFVRFSYKMPAERSRYQVLLNDHGSFVPYDGSFLIDSETSDLAQLVIHANRLPPEVEECENTTTLDYQPSASDGRDFLLPSAVRAEMISTEGDRYENLTAFSGCHEFLGESTLSFDLPRKNARHGGGAIVPVAAAPPAPVPANLPISVVLDSDIDTRIAAAGDTFTLKLETRIADTSGRVLVPKRSLVRCRILRLGHIYRPKSPIIRLAFRIEHATLPAGGVEPFSARLRMDQKGIAQPLLDGFAPISELASGGVSILSFRNPGKTPVIRRGLPLYGATVAAPRLTESQVTPGRAQNN